MTHRSVLHAIASVFFIATPVFAHHPGGIGNTGAAGPINTISATTLEQGRFAIGVLYEYIKLGGLSDAALINAASQHIHAHSIETIQSPSLGLAFGLTDDLMLAMRLPYVLRTDIREGHHSHGPGGNTVESRGDAGGLGDVTLLGQWRFLNNRAAGFESAILFGAKAPTGRKNRIDDLGELFEAEFQPGSGSWDGLLGLAATQRLGRWSLDGNVLYQFVGDGTQDTNLGDKFRYNAAVSYRALGWNDSGPTKPHVHETTHRHKNGARHDHKQHHHAPEPPPASPFALDLVLELNGEWHDKQVVAGITDPNSGGNTIYFSPGIRASMGNFSGFASVGIPILNKVEGLQSKPDFRVLTGIIAGF